MNFSIIFVISLALLVSCFADHDDKEHKREKTVSFYKCLSCGPKEALAAHEKCEQLKSEKSLTHQKECVKKDLPEEVMADDSKVWEYYCQNPEAIAKTFDCLYDEEYIKTLTEEDIASLHKFMDCAKSIEEQYCKE